MIKSSFFYSLHFSIGHVFIAGADAAIIHVYKITCTKSRWCHIYQTKEEPSNSAADQIITEAKQRKVKRKRENCEINTLWANQQIAWRHEEQALSAASKWNKTETWCNSEVPEMQNLEIIGYLVRTGTSVSWNTTLCGNTPRTNVWAATFEWIRDGVWAASARRSWICCEGLRLLASS